jgi:hypothetical protein
LVTNAIVTSTPKFIFLAASKRVDIEIFHRYKYGNGFNFGCDFHQH